MDEMNKQMITISRISKTIFAEKVHPHVDMLTNDVYQTSVVMSSLATELECTYFRTKYMDILRALCHDGL